MNPEPITDGRPGWPERLRPGAVRFARASDSYADTIAFYRDLVGLPVIGDFAASFGADGTIFGLPNTSVQLEVVRAQGVGDGGRGEGSDQLVLYLDSPASVAAATDALREAGLHADPEPHLYWAANGAVTYRDPDGRAVIFAPWVFGRDPDPLRIEWYDGDREEIRSLFAEAEDSPVQLDAYLESGRVLVARSGSRIIGHLQLVPAGDEVEGGVELKNMAVEEAQRGTGIGRELVETALRLSTEEGYSRMVVATAAADIGNLRFYQRCGFRFTAVEPDAFGPASGYPEPIDIDGIPLRDRVWLARALSEQR